MSFDAFCAVAMARELNTALAGAKVERVTMPTRDSLILSMRAGGETKKLLFSASPSAARLSLTERNPENPKVPPSFCLQLRHRLSGALVRSVTTPGTERVITVAFDAYDEMGFACRRSLIMEIMGGCSNVLFTGEKDGEEKILGLLRPVDMTETGRLLIPGAPYALPPKQAKTDPISETREGFLARFSAAGDKPCERFLLDTYLGFSPIVTREIAYRAGALDVPCAEADGEAVFASLRGVLDAHAGDGFCPTLVLRKDGEPFDFAFTDVTQYGDAAEKRAFPTLSALLDAYYAEKEQKASIRARSHDIGTALKNAQKSLSRKLEAQQKELAETDSMEEYRVWGDLLTSSLYQIKGKAPFADVTDYYSDDLHTVRVPLDETLTAGQNAARYYKKYNKLKTARTVLADQIAEGRREQAYLATVEAALALAETEEDLAEIRYELAENGVLRKRQPVRGKKPKAPVPSPMRLTTSGGRELLVGKNNMQNDLLSMKMARKSDWWFHVKGAPGSHVVMRCEPGEEPDASEFTEAAQIAAFYSSVSSAEKVEVDYTLAKNLKKPAGAKPGFVVYETYYSAVVTPRPAKKG